MCSMEAPSPSDIESHSVHHILILTDLAVFVSQVAVQRVRLAPFVSEAILVVRHGSGSIGQTGKGDIANGVRLPIPDKPVR